MSDAAKVVDHPRFRRGSLELAFLPASLEIIETPASPLGRAVIWTIVGVACAALAAAFLGEMDIVATAQGKIVPTGRTKVIQPLEIGVVRQIRVQDGQAVKEGDVLIELDPTAMVAERDRLASEHRSASLEVARLRAALTEDADPLSAFDPPEGAGEAQVTVQKQLLLQQLSEYRAKIAALDSQGAQRKAERATIGADLGKLAAAIPLLRERAGVRSYLAEKGIGSRMTFLEVQQNLVEYEQQEVVLRSRATETDAAIAANADLRRQTEAEFRRTLLADLANAQQKVAGLEQELIKAEQRSHLQLLRAPVDGVVQQLQVTTIGGVVTPAQQLMVIVPGDSRLEIQAMIQNKDIGFIHQGQDVEIKIDTFNFTKYGLLHGKVLTVSSDALGQDRAGDKLVGGSPTSNSNQEAFYAAIISLDTTQMQIDDKLVNLAPGMAATAEIKTGRRRLIEYLVSPLLRYKHDGLSER